MPGSKERGAGDGKALGNVCRGAPYSDIDCNGEEVRKLGSGRVRKPI